MCLKCTSILFNYWILTPVLTSIKIINNTRNITSLRAQNLIESFRLLHKSKNINAQISLKHSMDRHRSPLTQNQINYPQNFRQFGLNLQMLVFRWKSVAINKKCRDEILCRLWSRGKTLTYDRTNKTISKYQLITSHPTPFPRKRFKTLSPLSFLHF